MLPLHPLAGVAKVEILLRMQDETGAIVAPGAVLDMPVVEDGKVIPGKVMSLNASFDHRFIDGFHAGILAKTVKEMMENPFEKFDPD